MLADTLLKPDRNVSMETNDDVVRLSIKATLNIKVSCILPADPDPCRANMLVDDTHDVPVALVPPMTDLPLLSSIPSPPPTTVTDCDPVIPEFVVHALDTEGVSVVVATASVAPSPVPHVVAHSLKPIRTPDPRFVITLVDDCHNVASDDVDAARTELLTAY